MQVTTDKAVAAGILLPEDAADLMQRAQTSLIPDRRVRSPFPSHIVPAPS